MKVEKPQNGFLKRLGSLSSYTEAATRAAEGGWERGLAYFALGDRSVEDEHEALARTLSDQDKSFLIVIDDIDRLSPDEALLIFGLVKSVGRLPRVTYLLAFDRELIQRLLEDRYPSEGGQYLEKILQASFDLPPAPPETLRDMLLAEANSLAGMGDRVARAQPTVQRSGLQKIVDADRLHRRVTELLGGSNDLSDEDRQALERFLTGWKADSER